MAREEHNEICTHGGDMLAYLYDEMTASQRDSFELHLADCMPCIDGFAEISQSRYSVYEWKKLDFDPLQTPNVVIPYASSNEATASFFDKIRAAFANNPWATAAPAFGALLIAVAIGFVWFSGNGIDNNDLAKEVPNPTVTPLPIPPSKIAVPTAPLVNKEIPDAVVSNPKDIVEDRIIPIKASDKKPTQRTPVGPKPAQRTTPAVRTQMPTLAGQNEFEDDSLRLSDMFDDIDTSR